MRTDDPVGPYTQYECMTEKHLVNENEVDWSYDETMTEAEQHSRAIGLIPLKEVNPSAPEGRNWRFTTGPERHITNAAPATGVSKKERR
jgi:hypothetical protein